MPRTPKPKPVVVTKPYPNARKTFDPVPRCQAAVFNEADGYRQCQNHATRPNPGFFEPVWCWVHYRHLPIFLEEKKS